MKRFGIVSYNIYCNFTNYGSALQSWALQQVIDRLGQGRWESVLVDYCPDVLRDKNPLNPMKYMWDTDEESKRMCELSLPAIRENARKFENFYCSRFHRTKGQYTSENFNDVVEAEGLDGFVCGSDTIFCIDEFSGFDDGYYANYLCMQGRSVAYAASFGDAHFSPLDRETLNKRLQNFLALGLRERRMLVYAQSQVSTPVQQVLDPTLLLKAEDYEMLSAPRLEDSPYLLLYARRYDPHMWACAEKLATESGWKIIEISLRAVNADKHRMFYDAGVEEFLSLVKNAEFVVTNSYHGMIFSIQFQKNFRVFLREQCDSKITELMTLLGLSEQMGMDAQCGVDYGTVQAAIQGNRAASLDFLQSELCVLEQVSS